MEEELSKFGLTKVETKVYLALLKLGTASVQEVSKKAGTYRTYTYDILKSLKEKGLASYAIKSGKQYFEVSNPEKLISILEEKKENIERIMPDLSSIYQSSYEKPRVEVYEGKAGIKTILEDMLKTKKEILVYGSTNKQAELLEFSFPNFIRRRVKAKIGTKVITEKSEASLEIFGRDKNELREMRFLPRKMNFPTDFNIYGDKVAIFSLGENLFGIIVEDKAVANTQRAIFNILWSISKKK